MLHSVCKVSIFFNALLFLGSEMAFAQEKLQVLIEDGQVESRIGEVDRLMISSTSSVIESDRLRNNFTNLNEILEQEVGVQMRSSGGEGSLSMAVLRGASSEQVIVYLDGVALNTASGDPVDLSLVPVDSIERIEIYRGSTPLVLGGPSIGGAVNIITRQSDKDRDQPLSGQLSTSAASFQTYKVSGTSSIVENNNDVLLSVSYLQSKNDFEYLNNNGTQYNLTDDSIEKRKNDGVKELNVLANWKHEYNKKFDTELRLNILDYKKNIPSIINADSRARLDTKKYNFLYQINVHDSWVQDLNFNLKLFLDRKNESFDDSLAQFGFFPEKTKSVSTKTGVQLYAEKNGEHHQQKLITILNREVLNSESLVTTAERGESTRNRFELSMENISYLDNQQIVVNVVARYHAIYDDVSTVTDVVGVVTPGYKVDYQSLDPQLGLKFFFDKAVFLSLNIGEYNRIPSFYELYGGYGLLLGNLDLKPEKSINTDLGFTHTWYKPYRWMHDAELYAGVYRNNVENLIVRIYNGQGVGVAQNISDAIIQGFESTIKLKPLKNHIINASVSLIDSINKSTISSFSGRFLPGYYQQSLNFSYAYSAGSWLVSSDIDFKRNMYYDRSNLLKGSDVDLLNLSIRRSFKYSNLNLGIKNILDENIQYFRNRPTPGISYSLTYSYNF